MREAAGKLPFVGPEVSEVLRVERLTKDFSTAGGLFRGQRRKLVRAVDEVSFNLLRGEVLGLVGESGCGKTTLSRMILRLIEATSGRLVVEGKDMTRASHRELQHLRSTVQIVFQDPYASLDPRWTVGSIISEPLRAAGVRVRKRRQIVRDLMVQMGLDPEQVNRYPHQFSAGQRQRIGVARALAVKPRILVLDEPVSALDVSIQAQILETLRRLREEHDLSYILISHDLAVVRYVSDRIAVMYSGKLVELAPRHELYDSPHHPYTAALLSVAPVPDPDQERSRERIVLRGDVPNPASLPTGCPFHPRCFRARQVAAGSVSQDTVLVGDDRIPRACLESMPDLNPMGEARWAACHFPINESKSLTRTLDTIA